MTPDNRLLELLAYVGLAAIRNGQLVHAAAIEATRRRLAVSREGDLHTILTTKPVAAWTPEDHILFMDVVGEHIPALAQPAPLPVASAMPLGSDLARHGIARTIDDEIPF